jgi:hypothetical protein
LQEIHCEGFDHGQHVAIFCLGEGDVKAARFFTFRSFSQDSAEVWISRAGLLCAVLASVETVGC